jgi:hypothetical protein
MSERFTFYLGVAQRQEPVLVDALSADFAVEDVHEAVIGWLALT